LCNRSQQLGIAIERAAHGGTHKGVPVRHPQNAIAYADLNFFFQNCFDHGAPTGRASRPPFRVAGLVGLELGLERRPTITDPIGLLVAAFDLVTALATFAFGCHG
jgi:hypothetical protein